MSAHLTLHCSYKPS